MIQIDNLYKRYGKVSVLSGLNLQIQQGGIFAILGPNGSGKTTLIKSILGLVVPDKGDIILENESILNQWVYRKTINYLPQIANFPSNLSVKELITMIQDLRSVPSTANELIRIFKLEEYMDKKLSALSGGTKQKVNIVLCFMFDSPLIILDEPTTGLDPIALIHLKEIIESEKQKGKTILITSHIMSFVEEIADEVVFLLDGLIYFKGTVSHLKAETQQDNLEAAIASILQTGHA